MKATIAVTCFVSAILLVSAITQKECEAPHASSLCAPGVPLEDTYYYNNGTLQCEKDFGCEKRGNNFPSLEECKNECPYGKYASS
uniref:Putative secreted salivary protein n=1 Tax=Ixodes scapularis TaxID=6945 RepID=Q4PMP1_IXOSC|nr:putative secreted salivary protein [Ixodes scapularis]